VVIKYVVSLIDSYTHPMGRGFSVSREDKGNSRSSDIGSSLPRKARPEEAEEHPHPEKSITEEQILYGVHNRQQDSATDPFDETTSSYWAEQNLAPFLTYCAAVHEQDITVLLRKRLQATSPTPVTSVSFSKVADDSSALLFDYQMGPIKSQSVIPWQELLYSKHYANILPSLTAHLNLLGLKASGWRDPESS